MSEATGGDGLFDLRGKVAFVPGGYGDIGAAIAWELARHGITVNGVAPTVVRGAMASHWLDNPATAKAIVERIPLGRVAEPGDIVGAALFFCAPASDFLTGQILYADGGITASQ
jgi:gluconate 5-dehydrogenase